MHSTLKLKRRAYLKGKRGEWIAALYLRLKGYRILEKRYKTPVGEIDLIACKGKTMIAVEVKTRDTLEKAFLALTPFQQKRIERTLLFYLTGKTLDLDLRFDLVLISSWRWPRHIQGAWIVQ